MWRIPTSSEQIELLPLAVEFTGNHILYGDAMIEVVNQWKYSMENFITNRSVNYRAHIGHCACSYKHNLPELIVRRAWGMLSDNQRKLANIRAEQAKKHWEKINGKNKQVRGAMAKELLF